MAIATAQSIDLADRKAEGQEGRICDEQLERQQRGGDRKACYCCRRRQRQRFVFLRQLFFLLLFLDYLVRRRGHTDTAAQIGQTSCSYYKRLLFFVYSRAGGSSWPSSSAVTYQTAFATLDTIWPVSR